MKAAIAELAELTPKQFLAIVEAMQLETALDDLAGQGANRMEVDDKITERLTSQRRRRDGERKEHSARFRDFMITTLTKMGPEDFGATQ